MRNILAIALMVVLSAPSPAALAKASKEENIGVGTGAVVGALAGGPIGLIVGAAIGAKVGDTMHQKSSTIDDLSVSLNDSQRDVAGLESEVQTLSGDIDALSAEIEHLQAVDRPQLVSLMQAGIAMDLLFRTDEHTLSDATGSRLAGLAASLAQMPDIRVQLDGFADERGDAEYNQALSQKRVEFVREQLLAAGIDGTRIQVAAHGESPAQDDSVDSYALERRVSLTLFIDSNESQPFARNAN